MRQNTLTPHTKTIEQIDAIKANDEEAIRALYQANYYKIEHYVLNNSGSVDQAKDVYQEAFIAVWRNIKLDKFQPENETALGGYLFQVSKNKWLDHLRSAYHTKVIPIDSAHEEWEQAEPLATDENEYIVAVKNNFKNLGDNCRDVLEKFYYKKQSLRAIANAFGWTEATARNNKYRCLQRLRELMKN